MAHVSCRCRSVGVVLNWVYGGVRDLKTRKSSYQFKYVLSTTNSRCGPQIANPHARTPHPTPLL